MFAYKNITYDIYGELREIIEAIIQVCLFHLLEQ